MFFGGISNGRSDVVVVKGAEVVGGLDATTKNKIKITTLIFNAIDFPGFLPTQVYKQININVLQRQM